MQAPQRAATRGRENSVMSNRPVLAFRLSPRFSLEQICSKYRRLSALRAHLAGAAPLLDVKGHRLCFQAESRQEAQHIIDGGFGGQAAQPDHWIDIHSTSNGAHRGWPGGETYSEGL